ncbi:MULTISPECIES: glycoside hydrolase family 43 protein [Luteimonas]|uniref:glycoside hydrolase family 43 protein n=1 Tax=Luteimonas TaxID=83614 RepID=UPI000C7A6905|nr:MULTISPECIES: glycoside hydrolase family 43 protein [Luteimonas]
MIRRTAALTLAAALFAGCATTAPADPAAIAPVFRHAPLVRDLYIADPSAHVFDGRVYVYGSHDVDEPPLDDEPGSSFVMRDYRVLSMDRIGGPVTVHAPGLRLEDVPWAVRQLWAPDATERDGRYYLYFPAKDADGIFRIGVAVGDRPEGPFTAQPTPIPGSYSIDPAVFVDDDGARYLYFGGIHGGQLQRWVSGTYDASKGETDLQQPDAPALMPRVARLSDTLLSFAETPREVLLLDASGAPLRGGDADRRFFEAAWLHRHDGRYYFTYSTGDTHTIAYATGDSPYGPFTYRGVVLTPVQGWTTHHSIVEVDGRWQLFYHDTELTDRTHLRSAKVAELVHEADGRIRTIDPFVR